MDTNMNNNGSQPAIPHEEILSALLSEIKKIDFYQKADLRGSDKIAPRHYIVISIQEILKIAKDRSWCLCKRNNQIYLYNGAFWKQLSKEELVAFLGKAAENLGVNKYYARHFEFQGSLLQQFMTAAFLPKPVRNGKETLINLLNGTFAISPETHAPRPFNQDDFLTYQLPFKHTTGASAPGFQKFLDRVLPDVQQQNILAEYISYTFISQKTLKLEKSLILFGSGANGKSVFFEIIRALLGDENVTNFGLQSLTDQSGYYRAQLSDKLLNYASEISPRMDSTLFKALASGEPVEARLPYGVPFILRDYAKLIFNANELPRDVEQTDAFFRRFILINFSVIIPEEERDPKLAQKIIGSELPGVFNWVLEGLTRLLDQKNFTQSPESNEALKNYRMSSDSVQLFLNDEGYVKDVTKEITLKELYLEYKDYCTNSGHRNCANNVFSARLRNIGYTMSRKNSGTVVYAEKKGFE